MLRSSLRISSYSKRQSSCCLPRRLMLLCEGGIENAARAYSPWCSECTCPHSAGSSGVQRSCPEGSSGTTRSPSCCAEEEPRVGLNRLLSQTESVEPTAARCGSRSAAPAAIVELEGVPLARDHVPAYPPSPIKGGTNLAWLRRQPPRAAGHLWEGGRVREGAGGEGEDRIVSDAGIVRGMRFNMTPNRALGFARCGHLSYGAPQ